MSLQLSTKILRTNESYMSANREISMFGITNFNLQLTNYSFWDWALALYFHSIVALLAISWFFLISYNAKPWQSSRQLA